MIRIHLLGDFDAVKPCPRCGNAGTWLVSMPKRTPVRCCIDCAHNVITSHLEHILHEAYRYCGFDQLHGEERLMRLMAVWTTCDEVVWLAQQYQRLLTGKLVDQSLTKHNVLGD